MRNRSRSTPSTATRSNTSDILKTPFVVAGPSNATRVKKSTNKKEVTIHH